MRLRIGGIGMEYVIWSVMLRCGRRPEIQEEGRVMEVKIFSAVVEWGELGDCPANWDQTVGLQRNCIRDCADNYYLAQQCSPPIFKIY